MVLMELTDRLGRLLEEMLLEAVLMRLLDVNIDVVPTELKVGGVDDSRVELDD